MDYRPIYGLSSDMSIRKAYQNLSKQAQICIDRRDQIGALKSGVGIDQYLWLISNSLKE